MKLNSDQERLWRKLKNNYEFVLVAVERLHQELDAMGEKFKEFRAMIEEEPVVRTTIAPTQTQHTGEGLNGQKSLDTLPRTPRFSNQPVRLRTGESRSGKSLD